MKKLLKLALIVGGVTAVAKLITAKKAEWRGLTESQVREKLDSRLSGRVPDEKRAVVTDQIVSKLRAGGVIGEQDEATPSASNEEGDTADESPEPTTDSDSEDDTGSV